MTMSIVTITGGAGNLGRYVARLLADRGYQVRIFDLPEIDYDFASEQSGLQVVTGDIRDQAALSRACAGAEWVVHLAAIMPPLSEMQPDLSRTVNIDGTRALLSAMPAGSKMVFASSVATYGVAQLQPVSKDHPQQPIDFYGQTKVQNERDVLASGKPAAILRISGISVPALLEIPRPWFFSREQNVEFIHLEDAALAVANCVQNTSALGHIWQIAGGSTWRTTGQGYSDAICAAFDIPPESATFMNTPNWPAWFDTAESQAALGYQNHTFDDFIAELRQIYAEAIG
jgi:nucleoside-diphosphate-sugar epimerase